MIDGREGAYGLVEAPIPELTDARRMTGALGDGRVGGWLDGDLQGSTVSDLRYAGGGALALEYGVQDGVGVPYHPDGLELWTYYHTLSRARAELDALGVDTDPVFPVPFAYQPSVAGAVLSSNAAYVAGGVHLFVLLPGGSGVDVPFNANPGIIRHEFGHALFASIVAGDVQEPFEPITRPDVSALNEGFADMVATLLLDDPDFIALSLDLGGARDVTGDHILGDATAPEDDPYSRGTVYASFAWDLRELTDPDFALIAAIDALGAWADDQAWDQGLDGVDGWPARLANAALAERPALTGDLCAAFDRRFAERAPPASCL